MASVGKGAAAGATIGSTISPGLGTVIGGIGGAAISAIGSFLEIKVTVSNPPKHSSEKVNSLAKNVLHNSNGLNKCMRKTTLTIHLLPRCNV